MTQQIPGRLQLLIHPIFWDDTPGNRWDRLGGWKDEIHRKLEEKQQRARQRWLNHPAVLEHEQRLSIRAAS